MSEEDGSNWNTPDQPNGEWRISEVNRLFENKHFQMRLEQNARAAVFTRPRKVALWILAAVGITSIGGGVTEILKIKNEFQELDHYAEDLQLKLNALATKAETAANGAEKSADKAKGMADSANNTTKSIIDFTAMLAKSAQDRLSEMKEQATQLEGRAEQAKRSAHAAYVQANESKKQAANALSSANSANKLTADIEEARNVFIPKVEQSMSEVEGLRENAKDLATFKTFEFVTLRSHAQVTLNLKNIEPRMLNAEGEKALIPVHYELAFKTEQLAKHITLKVELHRQRLKEPTLVYAEIEWAKDKARPYYCLCGTPFMFQVDNYVHGIFVHDFMTLKVVGWPDPAETGEVSAGNVRRPACKPPVEPAECTRPDGATVISPTTQASSQSVRK